MVRSYFGRISGLACLTFLTLVATAQATPEDPPTPSPKPAAPVLPVEKDLEPGPIRPSDLLEGPIEPFVPLNPRTVEDRQRIEAITQYAVARALESRRSLGEAIRLLEEALEREPDSVAILRRLSKLCFTLGRTEPAITYSRKVIGLDPGDTETIVRLVGEYSNRRKNPAEAETLLKEVLANPKLDPKSGGRLVAEFELGRLYAEKLDKVKEAAESYAKVVEALDDREASRLSPGEIRRVLGGDEAAAYRSFGQVFLNAERLDLAVKAFEHGLDYDPDDPELPLLLARTLLKLGENARALSLIDESLKSRPQDLDAYEALSQALKGLNRDAEITPRLEAAALRDPNNAALQYALVDRYRETRQDAKADALEAKLRAARPTPQGYAARASSLLKRRKAEDLLKVIAEAITTPGGLDAVRESIDGIGNDKAFAREMLDVGLKLLEADPPDLKPAGVLVLANIAKLSETPEKFLPIQRLVLKRNPTPQGYKELSSWLIDLRKYGEAAAVQQELLDKFAPERNSRQLLQLVQLYRMSDQPEAAQKTAREALKLDPNDLDVKIQLAVVLSQTGQSDEAITLLKEADEKQPNNAALRSMLGSVLVQAGRNEEATALFKEMLEKFPNDEDIARTARSNLSIIYVNQGDYAKGEAELEILLERNPDEAGVNNDLGYLYAEQGKNLEKAESMIRKALSEDPENAAYLDSLGWVLFKRGKIKEAVQPLEKAVELLSAGSGADPTIFEHLGDVHAQLQDLSKARKAWRDAEKAALKVKPPDKRLPEIRKKLESLDKLGTLPKPSSGENP